MKQVPRSLVACLLLLGACEEPRRAEPSPPETGAGRSPASESADSAKESPSGSEARSSAGPSSPTTSPAAGTPPEAPKEPELPEFEISRDGGRIVVSGALRSPLQVERILADLRREFPDLEIESDLKVEYHRVAVGWPNRVSAVFLIDYLQSIESPSVAYRGGTVVLEGRAPDSKTHRELSEIAVETFADASTDNLENRIVVAEEGEAPAKGKGKGKAAVPAGETGASSEEPQAL